jgi:hypothetical protein
MLQALKALENVIVAGKTHLILGKVFLEKDAHSYSGSPSLENFISIFPEEMLASNKDEADTVLTIKWFWTKNEQRHKELMREIIRYGHTTGYRLSISSRRGKAQMGNGKWAPDLVGQKPQPGYWPVTEVMDCIKELAKPVKTCPECQGVTFLASPICPGCHHVFSEKENIAVLNATTENIQRELMTGDSEISEDKSQICAICGSNTISGSIYKIYYGNKISTTSIHKFKISGSEDVPICYKCLLTPGIKAAKIGEIAGWVLTLLTCWTIVGGIIGLVLTLNLHNTGKERQKAIVGNDKEMQRQYLIKERKNLDTLGYRLAAKKLKAAMKSQNQNYDVFFTPEEFTIFSSLIQS